MATRSLFVQSQNLELVYLLPGAAVNLGTVPTPQEGVAIDLRLVAPMPLGPDMVFGPHRDAVLSPVVGTGQDFPFGVPEDFDLPAPVQPIEIAESIRVQLLPLQCRMVGAVAVGPEHAVGHAELGRNDEGADEFPHYLVSGGYLE